MAAGSLWLACAACLTVQLFVPPFIGMANNGDFGKVAGRLALEAPDGGASNFLYFQPDYIHSARNYWHSPYVSSETALGWLALHVSGATGEGARFGIRWLGLVHVAMLLAALALVLGQGHLAAAAASCLIFTDVCYAAYCNSFYMDAAALCGLLLAAAAACGLAAAEDPSTAQIVVCALGALLYCTSKTQHAIWCWLPAALLAATGARCGRPFPRRLAWGAAAAVLAGGGGLLATADATNRAQALFNKLFFQIGAGPGGAEALREVGVRPGEMRWIGTHSYMPGSPAADRAWVEAFYARTGYGRLAGWYARHPGRALAILGEALAADAPAMRPENLSNFRREDGRPAGARSGRFALWSGLRTALLARWPWHMAAWYALFAAAAARVARAGRTAGERRTAWVALGIAALGAGQFGVAALADCLETGRHLFLFHACTDLSICLAVGYGAARFAARAGAR